MLDFKLFHLDGIEDSLLKAVQSLQYSREFGRGITFFGKNTDYLYSGRPHRSNEWPEWLNTITQLQFPEELCNDWNHCLINRYAPFESLGEHRDDEHCLDGSILSISLGGTAEFSYRTNRSTPSTHLELSHGDMLIADGNWWHDNWHSAKNGNKERFNLTFRRIKD